MVLNLSNRWGRIKLQKWLFRASVAMFIVALFLPSVKRDQEMDDAGNLHDVYAIGAYCALVSIPHLLPNALLLASPLFGWVLRRSRAASFPAFMAALALISLVCVIATPWAPSIGPWHNLGAGQTFGVGFYVWVAAHALMTFGICVPVWGPADQDVELRRGFPVIQGKLADAGQD